MKTTHATLTPAGAYLALLCATNLSLRAATITVTNTADSGPGTLRAALAGGAGGDTINFSVAGTITLTSGHLSVARSVTIAGPGAGALAVKASNGSRVFDVTGASVTIRGLTIADGQGGSYGAGIKTGGSSGSVLSISDCVLTNNSTTVDGGGIYNNPGVVLTISNCTICGNSASGNGGGMYNNKGTLTVVASTLSGNQGQCGGGIFNEGAGGSGTLRLQASTLHHNAATYGGGVYNHSGSSGSATVLVANSTLSANSATGCWAILNDGVWGGTAILRLNACTLSVESAAGGGLYNDGRYGGHATLELGGTILKTSVSGGSIHNETGTVTSAGYNLCSDNAGGFLRNGTDWPSTDPLLGPLQNNGGPTLTHAPSPFSPAADRGKANAIPALACTTDQRGLARPVDNPCLDNAGGDGSDIGAVELQPTEFADTDADGLSDCWELAYFGDLSQSGAGDFDGDGQSNLAEYQAGTDPTVNEYLWSYTISNGEITITRFNGFGGAVTIPSRIRLQPVVHIGDRAFSDCGFVMSVTIPTSVISIGTEAFAHCFNLTSVTIPDSVISIGEYAFANCSNLRTDIPNHLTDLGDYAFSECSSLFNITIPGSLANLGRAVFQGCRSLTSVSLPEGVIRIGDAAFGNCSSLTGVRIPNSVSSIGDAAFGGCSSLMGIDVEPWNPAYTSVGGVLFSRDQATLVQYPGGRGGTYVIPETVTRIAYGAFQLCPGLVGVTIPNSVTSIGDYAFNNCGSLASLYFEGNTPALEGPSVFAEDYWLTVYYIPGMMGWGAMFGNRPAVQQDYQYTVNSGAATIMRYVGPGGWVAIPNPLGGRPVIRIGDRAFYGCGNLTSVGIPNSVISIGEDAFSGCLSLMEINVEPWNPAYSSVNGVLFNRDQTTLLQYPSARLGSYAIPYGVTSLAHGAFANSYGLTGVMIPASLTSLDDPVFGGCLSLTTIDADPLNPAYSSVAGVLFNRNQTTLVRYPSGRIGTYVVPDTVTSIAPAAFIDGYGLTSVTLPGSVTAMGDYAFNNCTSLASLYFEGNAPALGGGSVFAGDNSLTVYYISGMMGWGATFGGRPAVGQVLYEFTTNSGATTITRYVGPGGVVTIPNSLGGWPVTRIGSRAFADCNSVTSVTIPNSVVELGDLAFFGCGSLTNVMIPNGLTRIGTQALSFCGALTSVTLPESLTSIGWGAFYGSAKLASVNIPSQVTSLGDNAFDGCASLIGITISGSLGNLGNAVFQRCTSLASVTILNGVTTIGESAFEGCYSLANVAIPNSVASIGDRAFAECHSLTSVTIPSSVTTIGEGAFEACAALPNVAIPNGVTNIRDSTFCYCANLTSVTIPNSVTNLGRYAFSQCSRLSSVAIPNGVISLGDGVFGECTSLTNVTMPNSVRRIGGFAFSGCTRLAGVTISPNVTSIGQFAFNSCTALTAVTIPASVTNLGTAVFAGCAGLTAITVAAGNPVHTSVDGVLFGGGQTTLIECPGGRVGAYTVPNTVTSIRDFAFYGCTHLTRATIPSSVTSVGESAFNGCGSLTCICFEGNAPSLGGSHVFEGDDLTTVYYRPSTTGWGATFGGRPTALASPSIVAQPANRTVAPGNPATFTVTAAGMPPFSYQWRKGGVKLAGATQSSFAIARVQTSNAGAYSVAVSNLYGGVISSNATLTLDSLKPTVTILSPTAGRRITNTSPVTISGKTGDNFAIASVWCQMNGTGWWQATQGTGRTNWSVTVNPKAGTNTVRVYAEDGVGNRSLTNNRSFTFVTFSPLTLSINGPGTVTPANLNGNLLEVGRSYTLTATPRAGCLFSNWVGTLAGLPSTSPTLRFLMQSNATLAANFVTNPFPAIKGSYYGLFADSERGQDSSGLVTLALTTSGGYSGSLKRGANSYAVSGQFDLAGRSHRTVSRPGTNAWELELMLLFGDQAIVGAVSNRVSGGWVADLLAYRAGFDVRTNPATQYAGKYTLIIPGGQDVSVPQGIGYAAIGVGSNGLATLAGSLADSTNFTQSVPVTQRGLLPVYASLYGGKGSVWGWLEFDGNSPAASLEGDLRWLRPALSGSRFYPAGFASEAPASGSRYSPPMSATQRVLALTNGVVMFEYGNLAEPIVNQITLTASNRVINLSSNKLSLSFTLSSGVFSGSVQVPGTTRSNAFKGILLQDRPAGFGYFLGTNQSGRVLLGPQD